MGMSTRPPLVPFTTTQYIYIGCSCYCTFGLSLCLLAPEKGPVIEMHKLGGGGGGGGGGGMGVCCGIYIDAMIGEYNRRNTRHAKGAAFWCRVIYETLVILRNS